MAKIRNTLVYRQLGLDYLFRNQGELALDSVSREDFVSRILDLKIPDLGL